MNCDGRAGRNPLSLLPGWARRERPAPHEKPIRAEVGCITPITKTKMMHNAVGASIILRSFCPPFYLDLRPTRAHCRSQIGFSACFGPQARLALRPPGEFLGPLTGLRCRMPKQKSAKQKVTFSLAAPDARDVQLAGDFTGWQQTPISLKRDKTGTWKKTVTLPPGRYEYRLLVDGEWRDDPQCAERNTGMLPWHCHRR